MLIKTAFNMRLSDELGGSPADLCLLCLLTYMLSLSNDSGGDCLLLENGTVSPVNLRSILLLT